MGAFYETIPQNLITWILAQKIFWVATAPLSANGHVNLSPKGGEYFGIINERTFWYMELTGSGIETVSHLHERGNGRLTVLFNAFEGGPRIVRLWGKGRVLENPTPEFSSFIDKHSITTIPGTRSIILLDVHQVGTSCGFSVPFYNFVGFRDTLNEFFSKKKERFEAGKTEDGMERYWAYKNAWSIDGMPGMKTGVAFGSKEKVTPMPKMVGAVAERVKRGYRNSNGVGLEWVLLLMVSSFVLGAAMMLYGRQVGVFAEEKVGMSGWVNRTGLPSESLPWTGQFKF